jgi:hypothetical protein
MKATIMAPNPYQKKGSNQVVLVSEMGPQSQQRSTLQKRTFKLAATTTNKSNKRSKGEQEQQTLHGRVAFVSERDCEVCKAQSLKKIKPETRIPHQGHDVNCIHNSKTKGKGKLSEHSLQCAQEEQRLKLLFSTPLADHKKGSWKHSTKQAGQSFFQPWKTKNQQPKIMATAATTIEKEVTAEDLCKAVSKMVQDNIFHEKHKNKGCPLAMLAFASVVVDKIINSTDTTLFLKHFDGLTMTVPDFKNISNPHYHSLVGTRLLLVDWKRTFGLELSCPDSQCQGRLKNDRTNFSKNNKTLFPLFSLDGAPSWCMVMSMTCSSCRRRFDANEADVLLQVPAFAAAEYPVDTRYAINTKSCHLTRATTEVFSSIMVTYGNGELCSRLLYNAINRAYLERIESYYFFHK